MGTIKAEDEINRKIIEQFEKAKEHNNIQIQPYIHLKTGNIYLALEETVIDATNKNDGTNMVFYIKDGSLYVREYNEFHAKFKLCEGDINGD